MDNAGERGALVLLDEAPIADVLEPPVGDGGGDLLHGVQAEITAVGKDRGEQRAHFPGVDPRLAWPLEVDAEPEVVLDLDEQVGEPDRATACVQPAVQFDQAVRVRRVGVLGRVRLQLPPGRWGRSSPSSTPSPRPTSPSWRSRRTFASRARATSRPRS